MDKIEAVIPELECESVNLPKEAVQMGASDPELLNSVYKELSERLGIDAAIAMYRLFKGQQINFPVRLFDPVKIQQMVAKEYNGTNVRALASKYGYSEKSIRRIIKTKKQN